MPGAKTAFDSMPYPKVVIVGGGFAGLELVKQFHNKPFRVYLLDKNNFHTFQPLLYQVASGSLSPDSIAYPFRRKISKMQNVIFRKCEIQSIDPENNLVKTSEGDFDYDHLILATGSSTNFFGNKNLEKWAMQLKSVAQALDIRSEFLQEFEKAVSLQDEDATKRALNFVVVGAGPTGVEVSGALAEIKKWILAGDYKEVNPDLMEISLIEAGPDILPGFSAKSSAHAKSYLEKMGVNVRCSTMVEDYDGVILKLKGGEEIHTDTVIWSAGVKGNILEGLKADCIEKSRYLVDPFNKIEGYENIYAIGDVALMKTKNHPNGHPMVAPTGIQQAQNLAYNFIYKNERPFVYKDKGSMATIGRRKAVVDMGGIHLNGFIAWLAWMFVHLMSLVGFKNRVVVLFNWALKYFSFKNTIRIIIRPFERKSVQ